MTGMTVVFLQMGWTPDQRDAGGESSPNWHKANALRLMRRRPELEGKLMIQGTWDYALVDELMAATGLGGRERATGSSRERARVAATKALTTAINRIAAVDESVGRHLQDTIQTGSSCTYEPDGDDRIRLFAPFGLAYAGGRLAPAIAQFVYWGLGMRDWWRARRHVMRGTQP